MSAAVIDIEIEQGSEYNESFTWKDKDTGDPIDLTSWTGKMTIRETKDKSSNIIHTVSTSAGDLVLDANGNITPFIGATDTDDFEFEWAFYDIRLVPSAGEDEAKRVVQGKVRLDKQVTV